MPEYPPPPPGNPPGPPPGAAPPHYDPYAADRALAEWAKKVDAELVPNADLNWYRAWYPCTYMLRINAVGRELRKSIGEAKVWLVEGHELDPIKQAAGEDLHLFAFVTSPKLAYRVAVRSKSGSGIVDTVGHGIESLFSGSAAGSVLGDPTFERAFDVSAPTREEGNHALPMPLRQLLLQQPFRGMLEVRSGGLVAVFFDAKLFEPRTLDSVLTRLGHIYQAATQYAHQVTPPPAGG